MRRGALDFSGDGIEIGGFYFGDVERFDDFSGESVPEKDFFTVVGRGGIVKRAKGLAARDEFFYLYHWRYYNIS